MPFTLQQHDVGFLIPDFFGEFLRLVRYDQRQPDPWDIAYEL